MPARACRIERTTCPASSVVMLKPRSSVACGASTPGKTIRDDYDLQLILTRVDSSLDKRTITKTGLLPVGL